MINSLPLTRIHRTGGGGRHYFFKHPGPGIEVTDPKIAPGIDIKADGGYVIWWPACGCESTA